LNKKLILTGFLLTVLGIAIYAYIEYNRKPANLNTLKADVQISAEKLVTDFVNDEATANLKYLGKVISVKGAITDIENQNDTLITIFLGDTLLTNKVSCLLDMQNVGIVKNKKIGEFINIKGVCTGFLMDVELNRCVIDDDK
jgi:hypothetical protein